MTESGSEAGWSVSLQDFRYAGAILAVNIAAIHLLHPTLGVERLLRYLSLGTLLDPRPLVFTLSALLLLAGIGLVYAGVWVRAVYAGGLLLMVTFLLGYVLWHTALDHGAFWPHIHAHGHQNTGALRVVRTHLANDRIAAVSKLHELALAAVLGALLLRDDAA